MEYKYLLLIIGIFLITLINASPTMNIFVRPLEPLASIEYTFNITSTMDCDSGALISHNEIVVMDSTGIGLVKINISALNNTVPERICEYKDGVLRANLSYSNLIFNSVRAKNFIGGNFSGDFGNLTNLNVSENVNIGGNLTLGQKITFKFGEIIDNIVNGWIRITGGLNITDGLEVENITLRDDGTISNESDIYTLQDFLTDSWKSNYTDYYNRSEVDTNLSLKVSKSGDTMTGDLTLNDSSVKIKDVEDNISMYFENGVLVVEG